VSDYLRYGNGARVEQSLLIDADDPFADIVDSELYDETLVELVVRVGAPTKLVKWDPRASRHGVKVAQPPTVATPTDVAALVSRSRPALSRPLKRRVASHVEPFPPVAAVTPRGPAGAATFVVDVEAGATVTYSWATDVITSLKGNEHRASMVSCPREKYAFTATITDADLRVVQGALFKNNATAQPFLVGLMHEGVTIAAPTTSSVVQVSTTAFIDWAEAGQRVVVYAEDPTDPTERLVVTTYVRAVTATTLTLNDAVGAAGVVGAVVMPAMACYLDAVQPFGQYTVNAETWSLKATALLFGNAAGAFPARGGSLTTFHGSPVFDRPHESDDVVARSLSAGSEVLDRGGAVSAFGQMTTSNVGRQVRYTMRSDADRQWFKAFAGAVRGRWKPFYLPSWRPDLDLTTDGSTGTITFKNSCDYVNTYKNTPSHQWLQFLMSDGTVQYRDVADAADNFDGTQSILLSSSVVGAIRMCSFLELARLDEDDVEVVWHEGAVATVDLQVLVNL
jgi:hypothetical protein